VVSICDYDFLFTVTPIGVHHRSSAVGFSFAVDELDSRPRPGRGQALHGNDMSTWPSHAMGKARLCRPEARTDTVVGFWWNSLDTQHRFIYNIRSTE
jgi:hypothetical protein